MTSRRLPDGKKESMVDVDPLPPPYRGTIRSEDEPSHSPLTAPVLITPYRKRSNRESRMNRSVQLRHRCEDEIDDGGVGGIVSDCDTPSASSPFGSSPFQSRLFAERMRCLTRQVHHFASTQANEFGKDGGNDAVGRSDSFQEEEKKADDAFISVNTDASSVDQAWSSLENAVQMVMEHCRLAQEEARESQQEQVQASVYRERATVAEEQNGLLQEELRTLKGRAGRLSRERKVLVREVKSLRQQLEQSEQKNVWRQVENYVVRALSVHESQLSRRTSVKLDTQSDRSLTSRTESDDGFSTATTATRDTRSEDVEDSPDNGQGQDGSLYVVVDPQQCRDETQERGNKNDGQNGAGDAPHGNASCAEDRNKASTATAAAPQATSTPAVRSSLGFGGHVALGFGRSYGKAIHAIKPKMLPSNAKPAATTESERSAVTQTSDSTTTTPSIPPTDSQARVSVAPAAHEEVAQPNLNPFTGYRSRVNSGELIGSTMKKFLQNGSNSIAGAISTATGRTSPLTSAGEVTPVASLPSVTTPQYEDQYEQNPRGCNDGHRQEGSATESGSDSPAHSASSSVPGNIVTNPSKDVSYLGSPLLLTPSLESPCAGSSSSLMMFELDCDPRILRSLSLPFVVPRGPATASTNGAPSNTSNNGSRSQETETKSLDCM
jgi:hypothetical protein